ncbi:hypothetical protein TNCV_3736771 [Trichonephila clavipes]|nr:hypothetical protein TNCV_3736771 [Trichonephila clavipes]
MQGRNAIRGRRGTLPIGRAARLPLEERTAQRKGGGVGREKKQFSRERYLRDVDKRYQSSRRLLPGCSSPIGRTNCSEKRGGVGREKNNSHANGIKKVDHEGLKTSKITRHEKKS